MGRCQINNLFLNHRGREAPMRGHIGNATGIFDSTLPYSRLVRIFRRLAGGSFDEERGDHSAGRMRSRGHDIASPE